MDISLFNKAKPNENKKPLPCPYIRSHNVFQELNCEAKTHGD